VAKVDGTCNKEKGEEEGEEGEEGESGGHFDLI